MKVGGRDFSEDKRSVELTMTGETPESIQKYAIEVNGLTFPPKQVLATVTGWERTSFTTMEAQRVLKKIGFEPYEVPVRQTDRRTSAGVPAEDSREDASDQDRIAVLEAAVATAQEAIAGLAARVRALESAA